MDFCKAVWGKSPDEVHILLSAERAKRAIWISTCRRRGGGGMKMNRTYEFIDTWRYNALSFVFASRHTGARKKRGVCISRRSMCVSGSATSISGNDISLALSYRARARAQNNSHSTDHSLSIEIVHLATWKIILSYRVWLDQHIFDAANFNRRCLIKLP